jgi:hypothetical protein
MPYSDGIWPRQIRNRGLSPFPPRDEFEYNEALVDAFENNLPLPLPPPPQPQSQEREDW